MLLLSVSPVLVKCTYVDDTSTYVGRNLPLEGDGELSETRHLGSDIGDRDFG